MKKVIVLGAGFSGLSVAWQIGLSRQYDVAVYEKSQSIGGLCGYYDFKGLKLDYGPHKIYSVIPGVMDEFRRLGGDRLKEINKRHKIILRGKLLDYPVKLGQVLSIFTFSEIFTVGGSVLAILITSSFLKKDVSYEGYCISIFGKKIYSIVFKPLAEKIWGDPKNLSADIAKKRIPTKSISDLVLRLLKIKKESKITNAELILYPYRGFYDICEAMAGEIERLKHAIHIGVKPVRFIIENNKIERIIFSNNKEESCDLVVSSIPLDELVGLLFPQDKSFIKENFVKMRHSVIVYLLISKPRVLNDHWIFCADKELLFSRISEEKLLSDFGFPKDKTVICCDFTCDEEDSIWKGPDQTIQEKCISGLEKLKIIKKSDVIDSCVVRIPSFYSTHMIGYEAKVKSLFDKINHIQNIICTGRLGLSDYYNVDHCLDMSIFIAEALKRGEEPFRINYELIRRSEFYHIVD